MKMGMKEFRERLGEVARGDQTVALTDRGEIVGHYVPASPRRIADDHLGQWLSARQRFRERWQNADPQWADRYLKLGLDEDGEPFENEPYR